MHMLYTYYMYQSIHIYMYMGKALKEMYLERDFQANMATEELRTLAAVLSWFYSNILLGNGDTMV